MRRNRARLQPFCYVAFEGLPFRSVLPEPRRDNHCRLYARVDALAHDSGNSCGGSDNDGKVQGVWNFAN